MTKQSTHCHTNQDTLASSDRPFAQFAQLLTQVNLEKSRILHLADELISLPHIPLDRLLETTVGLATNMADQFTSRRSDSFVRWLIQELAILDYHTPKQEQQGYLARFFPHTVSFPFQTIDVFGCLIAFYHTAQHSIPDKEQLRLIVSGLPRLSHFVEDSFLPILNGQGKPQIIYFEVQREKDTPHEKMSRAASHALRERLLEVVNKSTQPIVVPSNKELLFKSLKWVFEGMDTSDIPHLFIDLIKQEASSCEFSALVCQIVDKQNPPLIKILRNSSIYIEDHVTFQDHLLSKEVVAFSLEMSTHSGCSLLEAREDAISLIQSLIGPIRDINGGLLEKTSEQFSRLSQELTLPSKKLKNFFYSLFPQQRQALAPIPMITQFYLHFEQIKRREKEYDFAFAQRKGFTSLVIRLPYHPDMVKNFKHHLSDLHYSLIFSSARQGSSLLLGAAADLSHLNLDQQLHDLASAFYKTWLEKKEIKQILRVAYFTPLTALDPRVGIDEDCSYLHNMLFEGLVRIGPTGKVEYGIAERIEISKDERCYHFFLRKSVWSNGQPLTAHDFAYSWQESLRNQFFSFLGYLAYPHNHEEPHSRGGSQMKVTAIKDHLLEVRLAHPIPCFLELCAHSALSPICRATDQANPSWSQAEGQRYICNGPFTLERHHQGSHMILEKNPHYFDQSKVSLHRIVISFHTKKEAIQLFKRHRVDALFSHSITPSQDQPTHRGVFQNYYLDLNMTQFPFTNKKIRWAISLAIPRNKLVNVYSEGAIPSYTPYSREFSQLKLHALEEENVDIARQLLQQGMAELGETNPGLIAREEVLCARKSEEVGYQLVASINAALGLNWTVRVLHNTHVHDALMTNQTKMGIFSWRNRVNDPSYFLSFLLSPKNKGTRPFSCQKRVQYLASAIKQADNAREKNRLHLEVERLIYQEKSIIPLFDSLSGFLSHPRFEGGYSFPHLKMDLRYGYKK